jgi:hypothetical protein
VGADFDPPGELTPDLRRRLRILTGTLPALEAPDFVAGEWHDSERRDDGAWTMPWYELGPMGLAFIRAVGESGFMLTGFAWPDWATTPEAIALRTDREALARATPDQLAKLLTMLIREDRFNEGALAHSFESGLIVAIVRRAKVLAG